MVIIAVAAAFVLVMFLTKGIFSPAKLFAIMWTLLILGYYCFTSKIISGLGLLWIVAAMIILAIGERIGSDYAAKRYKSSQTVYDARTIRATGRRLSHWVLLFILIALIGKIAFLYANGYSLSVFFDIDKFMSMNTEMAYDRYNGGTVTNNLITLLSSFGYVAPLCGGYLLPYACKRKRRILLSFLSFFPVLLSMAMDNTKSGVIDAAILFAIGFMVAYMKLRKRSPKFKLGQIVLIAFLLLLLFALLFVSMCIRIGDFSAETIEIVKGKFIVYAFGSVEAFDVWLTQHYTFGTYGFGVNTFMAPFNLLGIVNREQGLYGFVDGAASNVFSAFRGVIMDFGIIGGLLFVFFIGMLGGIACRKIKSHGSVGAQFIYATLLFLLIRSYLCSPWIYTSFWITFVVFLLFIALSSKRVYSRVVVKHKQTA